MKTRIAINLFLLAVIFWTVNLYADWKTDWEQTVAAAKKEGRLNLYVGRYGQAALLDESKWYDGKHIFTDSEDQFIFVYVALPGVRGLSYNSNLVNAKEFNLNLIGI